MYIFKLNRNHFLALLYLIARHGGRMASHDRINLP